MSMSLTTRRSVLAVGRRMAARRFESTTMHKAAQATQDAASKTAGAAQETASKASAAASEYASKAAEGLSRVTSSAGPAIANAARGVSGVLGRVGGPIGRTTAFVERQTPIILYWSRVGLELSKLVFKGRNMSPPSVSTFQTYFQKAWKHVQNPSSVLQSVQTTVEKMTSDSGSLMQQARNVNKTQLAAGGVVLAECLGFFTVGEMIGRFKIVGYHGETHAHH